MTKISWNEDTPFRMPFGKYQGELVEEIPTDYLEWLYFNVELSENLYYLIETILMEREAI